VFDCLIVGAGPAGLTAALYLQRFRRAICIVDSDDSRARKIPLSRNYPGFPEGVNGRQLLALMRKQLRNVGGTVARGTVTQLRQNADGSFEAEVEGRKLVARTILLATGLVDIEPDIPGYERIKDTGLVRFCPVCDGFDFTGRRIGMIGRGAHGLREFEFVKNFSDRVTWLGMDPGEERIRQMLYVDDMGSIEVEMAEGARHLFDVLYCALGCTVRSNLAVELGALHDERRCLLVNEHLESSVKGLYAAGDVVSGLDQLAVATGQAAVAATAIHNFLRGT
jgi:thioredoxin reductase (NADPH)